MTAQRISNALVFSGRNGLDFIDLRTSVLRIPEVTIRIRQAQDVLDTLDLPKVDLFNVIASDDEAFFRNIKLKSLAAAVVQIGLFDRYVKNQRRPDFMVGNSNGDSAMLVCAGLMTFEDMVRGSQAVDTLKPQNVIPLQSATAPLELVVQAAPLLAGLSLTEFRAFEAVQTETGLKYVTTGEGAMDIKKIAANLHTERSVERFINIGPASAVRTSEYKAISEDIEAIDSIELDPMLGWFWSQAVRPSPSAAIAQ
jgi:hypothetical protein